MNIFSNIPNALQEELFTTLVESKSDSIRIERIVSQGHCTLESDGRQEWYNQEQSEWVIVVEGRAVLEFEDGSELEMQVGDYVNIKARRRHRVKWTEPNRNTVWLAIFY